MTDSKVCSRCCSLFPKSSCRTLRANAKPRRQTTSKKKTRTRKKTMMSTMAKRAARQTMIQRQNQRRRSKLQWRCQQANPQRARAQMRAAADRRCFSLRLHLLPMTLQLQLHLLLLHRLLRQQHPHQYSPNQDRRLRCRKPRRCALCSLRLLANTNTSRQTSRQTVAATAAAAALAGTAMAQAASARGAAHRVTPHRLPPQSRLPPLLALRQRAMAAAAM